MYIGPREPLPDVSRGRVLTRFVCFTLLYRSLLRFPTLNHAQEAQAQKCFDTFLGDTLLVDNIDAAKQLMNTVNNDERFNYRCPTILTRDGRRLNRNAVLGGDRNTAPTWERLYHKMWLAKPRTIDAFEDSIKKLEVLKHCISERAKSQTTLAAFEAQSVNTFRDLEEQKRNAEATLVQIRTELEEKQRLYGCNNNQPTTLVLPQRRSGSRSAREASSPAKRARR